MSNLEIEFKISPDGGIYTTYVDRLSDIREGFWVTKDGLFTKDSDRCYFILPYMVRRIARGWEHFGT